MVKAGDRTIESYRYAPNNGPLKTVTYGNGDTQEILYDKEERICARRWNGESTDDVRYEYDSGSFASIQTFLPPCKEPAVS